MLKRKFISAIAGVLAFAAAAPAVSAQGINVTVNVPSNTQHVFTNNNGGAWGANIVANPVGPVLPTFETDALGRAIVYCIDQGRVFGLNTNLNMRLLTFTEFVNNAPGISPWSTTSFNDLNAMAALIGQYTPITNNGPTRTANSNVQSQIWGLGTSNVETAPAVNVSAFWRVLVDTDDFFNAQSNNRTNGAQTFLVQVRGGAQVPEPASFALVGAGLVALVVASRRRNNVA